MKGASVETARGDPAAISDAGYPAPAKLNLMLRVTGRRPDGYHLLQTVFRFIDWSDTLRFRLREDGQITRDYALEGVSPADDLVLRAAHLLRKAAGVRLGVEIALDKRLPLGGGLGGGSSDAATTLIVLNRLWGVGFARDRLQRLALELGADVPVFILGEPALGEGIGECLTPVELPAAWYLVLVPPIAVATGGIFQHPDLIRDSNPIRIPPFSALHGSNDLEPVVCRLYPEVEQHLAWLRKFGPASMTGSGACVFASFDTEAQARAAHAQVPGTMRAHVAQGLDRHPLWAMCA